MRKKSISEIGDILFYINGAGRLRNIPLVAQARGLDDSAHVTTFSEFDTVYAHAIEASRRQTVKPDWFGLQFFNIPPYTTRATMFGPEIPELPLSFHDNGRWVIMQTMRTLMEHVAAPTAYDDESFTRQSAICLAGLSATLQNRLGSSLLEAALRNIEKRQRRKENGTLRTGDDNERNRNSTEPRPNQSGFDFTMRSAIFA